MFYDPNANLHVDEQEQPEEQPEQPEPGNEV
jgi:hypothetical protein